MLKGLKEEVDLWRGNSSAESRAVPVEETTTASPYAEQPGGGHDERHILGGVRRLLDETLPAVGSGLSAQLGQLGSAAASAVNDLSNLAANTVSESDVQRHIAVVHAWAQGDVSATHELYHRAVKKKKDIGLLLWYRVVLHTNRPNDMSVPDVAQRWRRSPNPKP